MSTLVLATGNRGKAAEFHALLDIPGISLVTPHDLGIIWEAPEETGETFAENARLKAQSLTGQCGLSALADDSGLCVDALGGLPGIYSARWAGKNASDQDRTTLLLAKLLGIPLEQRTARFVCAVALATPDGALHIEQGTCEGVIAQQARGEAGFGYDPVFLLPTLGRTFAELTSTEKNAVSHRAVAARLLRAALLARFPLTNMPETFP